MIAFITMIGTYGAMRFGYFLTNYISLSLADFLGSSLLLLIGIYTVCLLYTSIPILRAILSAVKP